MRPQEALSTPVQHRSETPSHEPQNPDKRPEIRFLLHDMPDIAHSQFVHRSPVDRKHQPDNGPVITVSPLQDEEPSHYESVNESHKQGERIPCRPWPSLGGIAIDVALSHHDKKTRAAILTKGTVQVYDLNLETFDVTLCKNYTVTHQLENARITLSGPFLATQLYFCNVEKGDTLGNPTSERLLNNVVISPQGLVALVRQKDILIKSAHSIKSNCSTLLELESYHRLVVTGQLEVFAHAAFNDVGKLLFAWTYGSERSSLYVWEVSDRPVKPSVACFPSEERWTPRTKVIPYNTSMGCIIDTSEKWVFPVQTPWNTNGETPPIRNLELKNLETGCVFQDCSFIAMRKRGLRQKWFLREYQIEHQDTGSLRKGSELCDLDSKPGTSSQLKIIRVSEKPESNLVAVICNLDNIELVKFVTKYDSRTLYSDGSRLPAWNNERYISELANPMDSGHASTKQNKSEHMRSAGDTQSQIFMGSGYEFGRNNVSEETFLGQEDAMLANRRRITDFLPSEESRGLMGLGSRGLSNESLSGGAFTPNDYTVGIFCALDKELMAVRILFDENHDPLCDISPQDTNHYAYGCIEQHNVVAACLPASEYGTNSAADAVSKMSMTFPKLRYCLLVGIAGGVPSEENDIRLGDVVISLPSKTNSGVIQYDLGKTVSDSTIELTGSLQRPPRFLLTAISNLKSDPNNRAEPLTQYIDRIVANNPEYKRPGREHDIPPEFEHEHKPTRGTCELCNSRREIRSTNHPEIHYGLIASGNQVMRDAKVRDNLGKKHKVLCFEMEAAGVMNTIPCLVIRGICDYADSHKNDVWQEYASATAAAYARLLLGNVRNLNERTGWHAS
ncbi:hypothetical protein V8E54_009958 [Elaphomyces granulatus]